MKKSVFGFVVMFMAATGFGAMVEKDMMELRLQGAMDFDNPEGHVETAVDVGLGYFIMNDIELGGAISFANEGSCAGLGLGVFTELLLDLHYPAAPFIGAAAQFRFGDYYSHNHLMFEINGGVKVFLMEYLAISGMIFLDVATDDVYVNYNKAENYDAGMRVGLNVYF